MPVIDDVFQALLYGEGFWIAFVLIMAICLIVANRIKFSGAIFAIVLVFLAVSYNENLSGASNQLWGIVLCLMGVCFLCGQVIVDFKG